MDGRHHEEDFVWVLRHAWRPHQDAPLAVRLPDCLVAQDKDDSHAWLFTNRQGVVLKRSEKTVGENVPESFVQACAQKGGDLVAHFRSGESQTIPAHRAPALLEDFGHAVLALCQDVPRGAETRFEARFRLEANGITHAVKASQAAVGRLKEVEAVADHLARHLARITGSRVLRMKLAFAVDAHAQKLWLTHVSRVRLADAARSSSSSNGLAADERARPQKKAQRRCAGAFCQYNEADQRAWMRRELPLDPSKVAQTDDDPDLLQGQQVRPSEDMHKVPYRAVLLGEEPNSLDMMDPLLRAWTLRQRAAQSRLKSVTLESLCPGLPRRRGFPVVPQDASLLLTWTWTGAIGFVDIALVSHEGDTRITLARACRNTGSARVHVPMVCPDWATVARPWTVTITDTLDARILGTTGLVALGGPDAACPDIPRRWTSLSAPHARKTPAAFSFADPKKLSRYHKTASVCGVCKRVYERLTAARIARDEAAQDADVSSRPRASDSVLLDDHDGAAAQFLPVLPRLASAGTARSQETSAAASQSRDPLRRTQSADAFFARLAAPKRASEHEADFQDARTWGPGTNLRKRDAKSGKVKRARKPLPRARQQRPGRSQRDESIPDGQAHDRRQRRRRRPSKACPLREEARADDADARGARREASHPYQSALSKSTRAARRKANLEPPHSASTSTRLEIGGVSQASDLFQVVCALSLGPARELCRVVGLIMASSEGVGLLASARVENGVIELAPETCEADAQGVHLVREYYHVCETFVALMAEQEEAASALGVDATLGQTGPLRVAKHAQRVEHAVAALDRLAEVHSVAAPRARIMRGFAAELRGDSRHACKQWRLAVADAARLEGMWCYNVGLAHLLLSRSLHEDPATGSHMSAATAIFRRLGQGGAAQHESTAKEAADDEDEVDSDEDDEDDAAERAALLRWAQRAIEHVEADLKARGRCRQAPRSPAEKDVWRLVDAARADMAIFAEAQANDEYFAHRRARVKDAIDLVETKAAALFAHDVQAHSSEDEDSESCSEDEDDDDDDDDDDDEEDEWDRYGPSAVGKEVFRLCRARDAKALEKAFRRDARAARAAVDTAGNSVLHAVAADNWIDGVHICLSAGLDIDARNLKGDSPLDLASPAVRTLLIALGATTDSKTLV